MPFTQLNTDFGGKFTAAAGAAVGDDIAKALQRYEEDKKKREFNDGVFEVLKDQTDSSGNSYISPDALSRWNSINPDKQAGILSAAGAKMQDDKKTKLAQMQIDAANQTSPYAGQKIYDDAGTAVGTWDEHGHITPYSADRSGKTNEPVVTDPLKVGDKEVPGIGVNRKTGQYIYFKESGLERDPGTGALGVRTQKGEFKPLTSQQLQALADDPNNPLRQTAPTTAPDKTIWQKLFGGSDAAPLKQAPAAPNAATNLDAITGQQPLPGTTAAAPQRAPAPAATVQVKTPEEAAALPPGTLFLTPDGRLKRRP